MFRAMAKSAAFLLTVFFPAFPSSADFNQTAEVSIQDQPGIQSFNWVRDFRYQRIMEGAPESTPHRRRALGGAERSHYPAYTMAMKTDHIRSLKASPWVAPTASADESLVIGQSQGWEADPFIPPQPVYGYKITDPETDGNKLSIVLAGANHGREHPACWTLHAMVDFLVSDDPRAAVLRRQAIFYVYPAVNPDGKYLLWSREDPFYHADGSPELAAAGHRNHNRIWHTDGLSTSADLVKAAMRRDTGGRVDYLLDFHGVPHTTFLFTSEGTSPYSAHLLGMDPSLNLRHGDYNEAWLRSWAMSPDGVNATRAYTPEVANPDKPYLFTRGKQFALGFYKLVSGVTPNPIPWTTAPEKMTMPPKPAAAWLFEDNTGTAWQDSLPARFSAVAWSETTRFAHPGNRSIRLGDKGSNVDFGQPSRLDATDQLTVAFWVRSQFAPESGEIPILTRSRAEGNQRSWALTLDAGSGELLLTLSSDGSYGWDRIKRVRTAVWPVQTIFNGRWRHLAFTFDGNTRDLHAEPDRSTTPERVAGPGAARIYLDGVELKKGAGSHVFANGAVESLHVPDAPILLGSGPDSAISFAGLVDELGIWTTALSATDIHWLANHSLREMTPNSPGEAWRIHPADIPNQGILFVDHEANNRSGHGGHAITEAHNGDILAFYPNTEPDAWDGHSVSGWTEYKISEDGGQTWSDPIILDYSQKIWEEDEFHSALVDEVMTAPNGTIIPLVRRYTDERWRADTTVYLRSYDHGRTWSEPLPVDPDARPPHTVRDEATLVHNDTLFILFRDLPARSHQLYVSTDNGESFQYRSTLPFARLQGYGAMSVIDGGRLIAYTYNPRDELNIQYSISEDEGHTWSEVQTTYLAKRIRNPQMSRKIFGRYFLHGRSGQEGDDPRHLVLYTSKDGINWDEGVFLNRGQRDLDSYSTNAIVGKHDPDLPERLLIQSSIAYEQSGRRARVNVHHWWIHDLLNK